MSNIQLNITGTGDFSSITQQLKALQVQIDGINKSIVGVGVGSKLKTQLTDMQNQFKSSMLSAGNFTAQTVQLTSETEKFGKALETGKLSLGQYFGIITGKSAEAKKSVEALAVQQVKLNNSIVQADITKQGLYNVYTPTTINKVAKATEIAAAKQNIFNLAVREGSNQLINFGKNTQWAGRQLTVGLSVPVMLFGSQAMKVFQDVNTELVRMQKVYGTGLTAPTQAALDSIKGQVVGLSQELARSMGIAAKDTAAMAADLAATGKTGNDLITATREAMRLSKLGEMDTQSAMQTTISLQNVYKLSTGQLSDAINFLNAVENQTSTSLQDLAAGIPKVGPIVQQLGGSFKDTAVMMVAMKEAGVPAAQSANAIKSAIASLINPTASAQKAFAAFHIDLKSIATSTGGNPIKMIMELQGALKGLAPLAQSQLIEKLFGKFQEARIQALITNLGAVNSQTKAAFDLAGSSAPALAAVAANEMKIATESTTGKFKRAVETLKADLLPVGQKIMEVATSIMNFGAKIASFFNGLPGPIKTGLGVLLTLGAIAGPVIMITGLFANLMGQVMRVGYSLLGVINGTKKWKDLMTPAGVAAKAATDLFNEGLMSNVLAVDNLNAALKTLIANLESINVASTIGTAEGVALAAESRLLLPGMPGFTRKLAGGQVPGKTSDGDIYPALLTGGEAVVPAKQAAQYAPFLSAIISGKLPGYHTGLDPSGIPITPHDHPHKENPVISKTSWMQGKNGALRAFGYTPGSTRSAAEEMGLNMTEAQAFKLETSGSGFTPSWGIQTPNIKTGAKASFNTKARSGLGSIQDLLDFQKEVNKIKGGVKEHGGVHSALYEFLQGQTQLTSEEKSKILEDADKELKLELDKLIRNGQKTISDVKLSSITEEAYRKAMAPNFKNNPKLKKDFEEESTFINGARAKVLNKNNPTGLATGGAVPFGVESVRDPNAQIPFEEETGRRFEQRTGVAGSTFAHTPFRGFVNRIKKLKTSGMYMQEGSVLTPTGKVDLSGAKADIAEASTSGEYLGDAVDKGFRSPAGIDSKSDSKKAKKSTKYYTDGVQTALKNGKKPVQEDAAKLGDVVNDGVNEGLNGPKSQSKLQNSFNKAFGSSSRLKGMLGKMKGMGPMGNIGLSMGATMLTQMAAPLIQKLPGGDVISGAMQGASMGAGFGPWGIAAGAAIGLVSGGIGKLIAAEHKHAATVKATFGASSDVISMFGGTMEAVTQQTYNFAKAADTSQKSFDKIKTDVEAMNKLPKDNPLRLVGESLKGMTSASSVIGSIKTFASAQVAAGMDPSKVKEMVDMLLTFSGQTKYLTQAEKEVTNSTKDLTTATTTWLTKLNNAKQGPIEIGAKYDNLTTGQKRYADSLLQITNSISSSSTPIDTMIAQIKSLGSDAINTSDSMAALAAALANAGQGAASASVTAWDKMEMNVPETSWLLKMSAAGMSTTPKAPLPNNKQNIEQTVLKPGITKLLTDQAKTQVDSAKASLATLISQKKITDLQNAGDSSQIKALQLKKNLLDAQLKVMQRQTSELKAQQQYQLSQADIDNQIRIAQASGDFLKASLLRQQKAANTSDYSSQNKLSAMQNQSADLGEQIAALKAAAQALKDKAVTKTETAQNASAIAAAYKLVADAQKAQKNVPGEIKAIFADLGFGKDLVKYSKNDPLHVKVDTKSDEGAAKTSAGLTPTATGNVKAYIGKVFQDAAFAAISDKTTGGAIVTTAITSKLGQGHAFRVFSWQGKDYSYEPSKPDVMYAWSRDKGEPTGIVTNWDTGAIKKATGGHIRGAGTATSDSIPAYLSNGEYVVKADSVKHYGTEFFDSVNAKRFAGGSVGGVVADVLGSGILRSTLRSSGNIALSSTDNIAAAVLSHLNKKSNNSNNKKSIWDDLSTGPKWLWNIVKTIPGAVRAIPGGIIDNVDMMSAMMAGADSGKVQPFTKHNGKVIAKTNPKDYVKTGLINTAELGSNFIPWEKGAIPLKAAYSAIGKKAVTSAGEKVTEGALSHLTSEMKSFHMADIDAKAINELSKTDLSKIKIPEKGISFNPEAAKIGLNALKEGRSSASVWEIVQAQRESLLKAKYPKIDLSDAATFNKLYASEFYKLSPEDSIKLFKGVRSTTGSEWRTGKESLETYFSSNPHIASTYSAMIGNPKLGEELPLFSINKKINELKNFLGEGAIRNGNAQGSMEFPQLLSGEALAKNKPSIYSLPGYVYPQMFGQGATDLKHFANIWPSGYSAGGKVRLPSFSVGTNFVPHDMIAQIHKGERIIPASQNNGTMSSTYNITVNAGANANADDIAKTVIDTIKRQNAMTGTNRSVRV